MKFRARVAALHQIQLVGVRSFDGNGSHEPAAGRSTIAGDEAINVFGLQTLRAMIAISAVGRRNGKAALFANKGFIASNKILSFTVHDWPAVPNPGRA